MIFDRYHKKALRTTRQNRNLPAYSHLIPFHQVHAKILNEKPEIDRQAKNVTFVIYFEILAN